MRARCVERLIEGASLYAAVASIADCVPLLGKTRILTKLGLAALAQTRHCGMRELLKASSADPLAPDSEDVAFRIAPRINAAGTPTSACFSTPIICSTLKRPFRIQIPPFS